MISAFEQFIRSGGGFVSYHAADNAFPEWRAYNLMIGIGGWLGRNEKAGPFWYFQDEQTGRPTRLPATLGITAPALRSRSLPATPAPDYQGLARQMDARVRRVVLQDARSRRKHDRPGDRLVRPRQPGTGHDEPMLMALTYGKGRIFHTTLGHDVAAMKCVGFIITLQRGAEWAATGKVTQTVPAFPDRR